MDPSWLPRTHAAARACVGLRGPSAQTRSAVWGDWIHSYDCALQGNSEAASQRLAIVARSVVRPRFWSRGPAGPSPQTRWKPLHSSPPAKMRRRSVTQLWATTTISIGGPRLPLLLRDPGLHGGGRSVPARAPRALTLRSAMDVSYGLAQSPRHSHTLHSRATAPDRSTPRHAFAR